jgi:hypothetical protein
VSFKYRIHDPRIGRFLSVDPLAPQYPWYTPYQFAGNKVIACAELEGLEEVQKIKVDDGTYVENRGGNSANIHVYDSENQEWAKYNVAYAVVSAKSLEGARTVPTKAIQQGRYVVRVQSYGNPTEFGMRPNELGTPTKPKYNANASAAQHALGDLRGDFLSTSARTKWGFPVKAELFTGPEWYIDVNKSLAYTNGKLLGVEDVVSIMRAEGVSEERITSWLSQQAAKGGEHERLLTGGAPADAILSKKRYMLQAGAKGAGKILFIYGVYETGVAFDKAIEKSKMTNSNKPILAEGVRQVGSWGGAWLGMQAGAYAGTAGFVTGPGGVVTVIVGGIGGGILGFWVGDMIGDEIEGN